MEGPRNPFARPRADSGRKFMSGEKYNSISSQDYTTSRMTPNKYQDAIFQKDLQDSNQGQSASLEKPTQPILWHLASNHELPYTQYSTKELPPMTNNTGNSRQEISLYPPKPPPRPSTPKLNLQQAITTLLSPQKADLRGQQSSAPLVSSLQPSLSVRHFFQQQVAPIDWRVTTGRAEERQLCQHQLEERRFPSREPPTVLIDDGEIDLYLRTGSVFKRDRSAPNLRAISGLFTEPLVNENQNFTLQTPVVKIEESAFGISRNLENSTRHLLSPDHKHNRQPQIQAIERLSFGAVNLTTVQHSGMSSSQRDHYSGEVGLRNSINLPSGVSSRPSLANPSKEVDSDRSRLMGNSHILQPKTPTFSTVQAEVAPQPRVSNTGQIQPGRTIRHPQEVHPSSPFSQVSKTIQYQPLWGFPRNTVLIGQGSPTSPALRQNLSVNLSFQSIQQQDQPPSDSSRMIITPRANPQITVQHNHWEPARKMSSPAAVQLIPSPSTFVNPAPAKPQNTIRIQPQTNGMGGIQDTPKGIAQVLSRFVPTYTGGNSGSVKITKEIESRPRDEIIKKPESESIKKDSVAFKSMFLSDSSQVPNPLKSAEQKSDESARNPTQTQDKLGFSTTPSPLPVAAAQVPSSPTPSPRKSPPAAGELKDSSMLEGESQKTDQYIVVEDSRPPRPSLSMTPTEHPQAHAVLAPALRVWADTILTIHPRVPAVHCPMGQLKSGKSLPGICTTEGTMEHLTVCLEKLPAEEIMPQLQSSSTQKKQVQEVKDTQANLVPAPAPPAPRDGSFPLSPQRGSYTTGQWGDESQIARALDQLYSGQNAIMQQVGNLAVGNPWIILKELETRTEREQKKLEQILLEKERMEGVIEGLREQLRDERAKFQNKRTSQTRDLRPDPMSANELKPNNDKAMQPSYSKSQIVQANVAVDLHATNDGYLAVDPLHGFASMIHSQILGHEENQTHLIGSTKGDKMSVKSKGLSASKITYNPASNTGAQKHLPREVIESQAVNTGNYVPYYWQGIAANENVPVLFDIKGDQSVHKSSMTGEGENGYLGKKIVSRFATILPGQLSPNAVNDELTRLREMNERLTEENRQLAQLLKRKFPDAEPTQPTPRETEKTISDDAQSQHQNYRKIDYFGSRPSIQTKIGNGFMNINLAVPDIRTTQHSGGKALLGELSPVMETEMDGVRVSGPPEAEQLKETQLQQLQNYLSPEPQQQENQADIAQNRGYNSTFSFQPSMEMISALTHYVNNPNMTAEQSGIKGLPILIQSKTFGMESSMQPEGGRASVATGNFGLANLAVSSPIAAHNNQVINSQFADTTSGLKGSNTEHPMSASNADANLDHSSAQMNEKAILVGQQGQAMRRQLHQKKRNLSDTGRMQEAPATRITEVAEQEEGQHMADREIEEEFKKKDEEILMLRTIIDTLAQDGSDGNDKPRTSVQNGLNNTERSSHLLAMLNEAIDHHFGRSSHASNQRISHNPGQRSSVGSTSIRANNLVPSLNLGHILMRGSHIYPATKSKATQEEYQDSQRSYAVPKHCLTKVEMSEEYRHDGEDSFGQQESPVRVVGEAINYRPCDADREELPYDHNSIESPRKELSRQIYQPKDHQLVKPESFSEVSHRLMTRNEMGGNLTTNNVGKQASTAYPLEERSQNLLIKHSISPIKSQAYDYPMIGADQEEENF